MCNSLINRVIEKLIVTCLNGRKGNKISKLVSHKTLDDYKVLTEFYACQADVGFYLVITSAKSFFALNSLTLTLLMGSLSSSEISL